MQVDVNIIKKENASALLEIEVDKESVKKEFDSVTQNYQKNVTISGFRKGKAPLGMVKMRFKSKISEDVQNNLVPKAYAEAVDFIKISPYTVLEIKIDNFEEDALKFKVDIQLRPEVTIGQYKNLVFHKDECKISSKDIDKELEKLQERFADYVLKGNNKIEDDDILLIKMEAFDEDKNMIKELSNENSKIEVKKYNLHEEFYTSLIGSRTGDEKEFVKVFPEDFNNKQLAGKKVLFKINIKEVRAKKFPELDDEFAKDVGDYKSLNKLRTTIEEQLKVVIESHLDVRLEKGIIDKIIENSKFEIPVKLIENRSNFLLNGFKQNLIRQGHDFQSMVQKNVINQNKIEEEIRDQAVKDLKEYLVVGKIGEQENIKVEDEEIDNCIKEEAEKNKQNFEEYKKKLNEDVIDLIKQNIMTRNVLVFLKENNKIKRGKTYNVEDISEHRKSN